MKSKKSFNNILFRMLILISAIPMLFISLSVIVMEVSDYYTEQMKSRFCI